MALTGPVRAPSVSGLQSERAQRSNLWLCYLLHVSLFFFLCDNYRPPATLLILAGILRVTRALPKQVRVGVRAQSVRRARATVT